MYVKELEDVVVDEIIIEHPEGKLNQFQETYSDSFISGDELTYLSSRKFTRHEQPNQIREALKKGYVEMSHINLTICSECLHAEYEAEHMVERLVSGG